MGHNDHLDDWDTEVYKKTCSCGAVYKITESDGIPGCRSIEKVYCKFCGKELARHFGDCDGVLISDKNVRAEYKKNQGDKEWNI